MNGAPALLAIPDFDIGDLSMDELNELRAALFQMMKAQERETEAVKRIIAMVDKRLGIRPVRETQPVANASIASAVTSRQGV